jgi:head-tail adaptor
MDKLLQTSDLEYMRSEAKVAMPDTVTIQRKALSSDQQGGYTESYDDAYQNIPARLAIKSVAESIAAGVDATLTVAYDQSIEQSDRVVHSSGSYEIQSVDTGKSWAVSKRCQMRQL